jgi:putative nucleotidyltransferase with HDIG domain
MSMKDIILSRLNMVQTMSPAATKAVQLLQDENVDSTELSKIISRDPALSANLLRLCNSAAFKGRMEVDSVIDAIVRLGARQVMQLVMLDAVGPVARPAVKGYDLGTGDLLEHSIAVAIAAECLAAELKLPGIPFAYTAALLHDIGKSVLGSFVQFNAKAVIDKAYAENISFEEAERQQFGIDHAELGAALMENWNLPASIVEVVRFHHCPEKATKEVKAAYLVHTADMLAMQSGIGVGVDGFNYSFSLLAMEELGLKPEVLDTVMSTMLTELEEIREMFGANSTDQ